MRSPIRLSGIQEDLRKDIKIFVLANSVDALGTGLYVTIYVTFAVRVVGLSAQRAGFALSAAGVVGLVGAIPLVALLDRMSPRTLQIRIYLFRAAGYTIIAFAHSAWIFILTIPFVGILDRASGPVVQALVADGFSGAVRTRALSLLRASRNAGFVLGALIGSVVFLVKSDIVFTICILINSVSFLVAAGGFTRLSRTWDTVRSDDKQQRLLTSLRSVFSDRPYLRIAIVEAVLALHGSILTIAVPLWIILHTHAPHWSISLFIALNCCIAIAVQSKMSKGSENLKTARRISSIAGFALALCCVVLVIAGELPVAASFCALLVAVVALTLGEVWQSAGSATLSLDLAPAGSRGAYMSVFSLFLNLQAVLAPVLLATCVSVGYIGLLALAGVFILGAAAMAAIRLEAS